MSGLSSSERKLLTIGVELAGNPAILFLDEPTVRRDCGGIFPCAMSALATRLFILDADGSRCPFTSRGRRSNPRRRPAGLCRCLYRSSAQCRGLHCFFASPAGESSFYCVNGPRSIIPDAGVTECSLPQVATWCTLGLLGTMPRLSSHTWRLFPASLRGSRTAILRLGCLTLWLYLPQRLTQSPRRHLLPRRIQNRHLGLQQFLLRMKQLRSTRANSLLLHRRCT